ncbi:hypothetical protein PUN28_000082 [Cardiocondyla obscurior]|uniref:Uncharacterized protein n=1 Tax=Cardiocondyla obscurior TaxID=286306 RepID=A0AAW2GY21_9HYME
MINIRVLFSFSRISFLMDELAESKIDAFVEDNEDKRKLFITQCENQVQGYCENLQRVLSDYEEKTKNCRKYYEVLKEKDEKDQQMIAQQLLRTTSLFEEIRRLQGKITVYDATAKKEISKILTEHDFFQGINWTIKNNFFSELQKLINFWRRFGLVQITIMQLLSEKNKLKAELNYLRKCINSYMTQKR